MTNAEQSLAMYAGNRRRRVDDPGPVSGEPLSATLARADAAMGDDGAGNAGERTTGDATPDPAPSAPAMAQDRAQFLVTNISNQVLGELRDLRGQIDALMTDVNERRDMIGEAIRSHAEFSETAIQAKIIIAESIGKMRAAFETSRTPLPPTHRLK